MARSSWTKFSPASWTKLSFPPKVFALSLSVITGITALLSILVLAFKGNAFSLYNNATDGGGSGSSSRLRFDDQNGELLLSLYPRYLWRGDTKFVLAGAGISLGLSVIVGLTLVFVLLWKKRPIQSLTWQRMALLFTLITNCIISLAANLVSFIFQYTSAHFDPSYRSKINLNPSYGPYAEYDGGRFDLESWSCQLDAYPAYKDSDNIMSVQCTDETSARWLGFVLLFFNVALGILILIDMKGQKVLIKDWKSGRGEESDSESDDYI